MPVARYFLFVGGALLALLLVVSAALPQLPDAQTVNTAAELPVIRIHSDRKWPERVVFDTSAPTIVPVQTANNQTNIAAPAKVAEVPVQATAREAFAQLTPPELKKPEPKQPRRRKIAKRHVAPPTMMVAQQPQFGFFGNRFW
ncbi:hypothetical protein [Bradyrhizobium canariense]|uniref:Uncharacterized protein n=1 Tax=Bradyrhizobium canariense TaxID=255045 RepID=A0A1H1NTX1_9BRAD|nr:hypothetical protein [Bradyrhizobium canariense]SDS02427.1 hypothetical protein SAMN05444158_0758 [Bradyrhizobium canariense]